MSPITGASHEELIIAQRTEIERLNKILDRKDARIEQLVKYLEAATASADLSGGQCLCRLESCEDRAIDKGGQMSNLLRQLWDAAKMQATNPLSKSGSEMATAYWYAFYQNGFCTLCGNARRDRYARQEDARRAGGRTEELVHLPERSGAAHGGRRVAAMTWVLIGPDKPRAPPPKWWDLSTLLTYAWWAVQRKLDVRILWPICKRRAGEKAHEVFMMHAVRCRCWVSYYRGELWNIIKELK